MALNINQFAQSVVKGVMDLSVGTKSVLACQVDSSSAGNLIPAQAVKLVNVASGIPNIVECSADTDDVFGFIAYNIKDQEFDAGAKVEVAMGRTGVMYMEASAAIAVNAPVMIVVSGQKVATATAGKMIIGRALDKASASGDLIRVMIDLPGALA